MKQYIFETLEFDRIINQLASHANSPQAKENVLSLKPLSDITEINDTLSEVTELRAILDFDDPFPVYGIRDVRVSLKKASLAGNYLATEELIAIAETVTVFRRLSEYFKARHDKYPLLQKTAADLLSFTKIEKEINRCIDFSSVEIRDNASPNLARIRRSILSEQQNIRKKMENLVNSFSKKNYLQENLITIRDGRLVLMIKDEYKRHVKGIIHDQSATGATLFVEPMETMEINNRIRKLILEEKREIEIILRQLTDLIHEQLAEIKQSLAAAAELDFIHAKAQFSSRMDGIQPVLNSDNYLNIINAKHPLLLLRYKSTEKVVPLNISIGKEFNTLIITGPNAGGKTVALKTVGLLSLMVACGLHIPAHSDTEMCTFQNIYADIGDQQSIEDDLSTFSSHIQRLKNIIDHTTGHDLVIIDEIGTGTDPEEGAALAISMLEKLTHIGSINLVSTHLGALKAFAHETARVENGSMEFNAETLQPTYRFRTGLPGSSYAFEISERYGLSREIITRARSLVGAEKSRLENLLVDLDKKITQYQSELEKISIKQQELNTLTADYEQKTADIKSHEKNLKKQAIQESEDILKTANATIELAIKEIKEQQASREAIKSAKAILAEEKHRLNEQKRKMTQEKIQSARTTLTPDLITIGQTVFWKSYNQKGKILSDADASNRVLIDTGGVKVKVNINELQLIEAEKPEKQRVRIRYEYESPASTELDLRGMRAEDAETMTDKFIQDAVLAGLEQVQIIHGKGTGALRKVVHELLEKHPHVKNKNLGNWNQGGTGVTIVQLK